ncbi:isochorismatase family protein [Pseudacidovorax intermedius]|uniref:Ureidoacrylate peracid hydrolase n=1 Tax=Pseudacidovorax intermedius TaxID=433924 RepID=A0A370F5R7_9BURK|nr:isochorismatase family protein [Pseudacidovorax intermedius]RDI19082.1 ureidoacrylate peracid hydrolase [Pseudacidovorax intermedius]
MDGPLAIDARPGAVHWRADETALIVVDMQNGFLKPGGYFDNVGYDLAHAPHTVAQVVAAVAAARQVGVQVIFIQSGFDAMHLCVGGATAPVWHKSEAQVLMRERPELARRLITDGTWDYELVEEMAPAADEPVIRKSRYSAFAGTSLDQLLRARRMRNLVFCGVAANVCVETSLRDAYGHEYFVLLLEDATHHAGPDFLRQATLWNVERFFGWVAPVAAWQSATGAAR